MQRTSRGYNACAAVRCTNNQKNCKLSFFRFPKDIHRARRWAIACGRQDLLEKDDLYTSYRLCGAHFENHMFLNDLKNRLHQNVTPTLFYQLEGSSSSHQGQSTDEIEKGFSSSTLFQTEDYSMKGKRVLALAEENPVIPVKIPKIVDFVEDTMAPLTIDINTEDATIDLLSPSSSCQTSPVLLSPRSTQTPSSLTSNTPRKQNYKSKIKQLQRENAQLREQVENIAQQKHIENITLEEFQQLTYKFCPRELAAFINIQLSQIEKKPKGRRYSNE